MKKFFLMLGFVLLVALVQASPPPGEKVNFDLSEVSVVVNDVDYAFVAYEMQAVVVREVAPIRKYSNSVTVNEAPAIEISQELTAIMNTTTDIEFTLRCPPTLRIKEGEITNDRSTFLTNKKNSNYGYPLSARTKIVFS